MRNVVLCAVAAIAGILLERKYKVSEIGEENVNDLLVKSRSIGKFVVDNDPIEEDEEELINSCDDL